MYSFKIAGISYNQQNCELVNYDMRLKMRAEPTNTYDPSAILILTNDDKKLGYIPNKDNRDKKIKKYCKEHIDKPLKITNISSINNITGIRVEI